MEWVIAGSNATISLSSGMKLRVVPARALSQEESQVQSLPNGAGVQTHATLLRAV